MGVKIRCDSLSLDSQLIPSLKGQRIYEEFPVSLEVLDVLFKNKYDISTLNSLATFFWANSSELDYKKYHKLSV